MSSSAHEFAAVKVIRSQIKQLYGSKPAEEMRAALPDDLGTVPGRLEVLMCQHETSEGLRCWIFEIKRSEDGRICALAEMEQLDQRTFQSNMWLLRDPNAGHTRQ